VPSTWPPISKGCGVTPIGVALQHSAVGQEQADQPVVFDHELLRCAVLDAHTERGEPLQIGVGELDGVRHHRHDVLAELAEQQHLVGRQR